MSGVLNDCDALLQAAPVRFIPAGEDAAAALAAAEAAQDAADAANAAVADMARDDLLSSVEKPAENLRWNAIVGERPGIDAQAAALGIITERTAYTNAYNALNTYITGLGTQFSTIPGTAVAIVGATYRANFKSYYDARQAVLNAIAAASATKADVNSIAGMHTFRVLTQGGSRTAAMPAGTNGLYKNGSFALGAALSYNLAVIRRSDGVLANFTQYDIYSNPALADTMKTTLNTLGPDYIVVIYSSGEPYTNRLGYGLPEAMYRCGASRSVFGSSEFKVHAAYCLIGIPGCGEGNGAEFYQGAEHYDPNAWIDVSFVVANGNYTAAAGYTPRSLKDYGYNGDMNATVGAPAGTNVGSTPATTVEANAAAGANANGKLTAGFSVGSLGAFTGNKADTGNTFVSYGSKTAVPLNESPPLS